jgi:hypothetical protein
VKKTAAAKKPAMVKAAKTTSEKATESIAPRRRRATAVAK